MQKRYPIQESSPQAKHFIDSYEETQSTFVNEHKQTKYPYDEMKIGESFVVPMTEASESSLRGGSFNKGKASGKIFKFIAHKHLNVYEVARIA